MIISIMNSLPSKINRDFQNWHTAKEWSSMLGVDRKALDYLVSNNCAERRKVSNPIKNVLIPEINQYKIKWKSLKHLVDKTKATVKPSEDFSVDKYHFTETAASNPFNVTKASSTTDSAVEAIGGVHAYLKHVADMKQKNTIVRLPAVSDFIRNTKILSLSDLHIPFCDMELVDSIIEQHKDADVLVLNGDILDGYAPSSFAKDKAITMHTEYVECLEFVRRVSKIFPSVYLVRGNHEQRVERYFTDKVDSGMSMFVTKDALAYIAEGWIIDEAGNKRGCLDFSNVHYNVDGNPWILRLGKTVFLHPSSFSQGALSTVTKACDYLTNFLEWDSFDSVVMGHTHKLGKAMYRGKLLIEQGSLSRILDYQRSAKFKKDASVLGYAVIYQNANGETLVNESAPIYLGTLNYLSPLK